MGLRVRDALSANAMSIHLQILMTRTINVNPSGCDRPHIARDNGADVFLSIHFDGNDSQAIRGPRTYVRKTAHGNTNHVEDSAFAARIQEAVTTLIPHPTINAQVRDHDDELAVLNDDNLGEPPQFHAVRACFAELEFLTNPAADDLFNTSPTADSFKDQLAEAIARAIIDDIDNQP